MASLRVLLDQNMTLEVGEAFSSHGHDVLFVREELTEHEADRVIWTTATARNVIVVSFDRDFRMIANQISSGQQGALKRRAGLISLSGVRADVAARRVTRLMPEIEFTHDRAVMRRVRFQMNITATSYTVVDNAALRPE